MTAARSVDVLLIGGGIASASAASELREQGFAGSILIACRESDPPYHRPPITKGYLQGREAREQAFIHPLGWYEEHDVEVMTRTSVMSLDPEAKTAKVGKEDIAFGHALLATGAMVRRLSVDGAQCDGIHYLRALGNADALRGELDDAERIVVVGGSYIATEVAASLASLGHPCTLVMQEAVTLERSFGKHVGQYVQDLLEAHGVRIVAGETVIGFAGDGDGDDDRVAAVITESGARIPADLVVIGSGAVPDAMLARRSGLELGETGGVACDARLQTSAPGLYAAGDVCEYDSSLHGQRVRIEHHEVAAAQGRTAARNILGADEPFEEVPYFWSDLADWATLEYVGTATAWDEEIVCGAAVDGAFTVWYLAQDRLTAALAVGNAGHLDVARSLLRAQVDLTGHRAALADPSADLEALVATPRR